MSRREAIMELFRRLKGNADSAQDTVTIADWSPDVRRVVALHEAGHTVATLILFGAESVEFVRVNHNPITQQLDGKMRPDAALFRREWSMGDPKVALGEVVMSIGAAVAVTKMGKRPFDVGSPKDLESAWGTIFMIICGMQRPPLDVYYRPHREEVEAEARRAMKFIWELTEQLINHNRDLLDAITERLVTNHFIGTDELRALCVEHQLDTSVTLDTLLEGFLQAVRGKAE